MRIKKHKTPELSNLTNKTNGTLLDDDFASIIHESKSERFFTKVKPLINVTLIVTIFIGLTYGGVSLFGAGSHDNSDTSNASTPANQSGTDNLKLSNCLAGVDRKHKTPEPSDANFYPKLISSYDAQLSCHDKYPDANSTVSRNSIEYAREDAINSSDEYEGNYSSQSDPSGSHMNATTGCDYSLSQREYLKCTDRYYAANESSDTSNNTSSNTPSSGTARSDDASTSSGSGPSDGGSEVEDPRATGLAKCLEDAKAKSYNSEAARVRAMQYCYSAYSQ